MEAKGSTSRMCSAAPRHGSSPGRPSGVTAHGRLMASIPVPHSLRRTAITLLHKEGVPDVDISDQAGHSDPNVTRKFYWGRDFMGSRPHIAAVLDV
ncbi:MAG: uncharacterized protein JWQ99_2264 [Blastococcus sp.]|jgi:integrase|nr:uncharacterized protein [Blastococcus sp.]